MTGRTERAAYADLEQSIARLLTAGVNASIALLAIGAVLMFALQIDPTAGAPPFEPGLIADDILHLRPAGFMSLGLIAVLVTPATRVAAALISYVRTGERTMALVALLILVVIALSVALAGTFEP